jgi:hypothetical protein
MNLLGLLEPDYLEVSYGYTHYPLGLHTTEVLFKMSALGFRNVYFIWSVNKNEQCVFKVQGHVALLATFTERNIVPQILTATPILSLGSFMLQFATL